MHILLVLHYLQGFQKTQKGHPCVKISLRNITKLFPPILSSNMGEKGTHQMPLTIRVMIITRVIDTPNPPPQECVDPVIETLWKRILSIESQIPPVIAPMGSKKLPCFDFQKSGHCARGEACGYFHDPAAKHSKRQRSPSLLERKKIQKKCAVAPLDDTLPLVIAPTIAQTHLVAPP